MVVFIIKKSTVKSLKTLKTSSKLFQAVFKQ